MPFAKPAPNSSANASPGETSGNALYRIDTQGFVSELFRAPVVIYGIAQQDDTLLLATGNSGSVYQLRAGVEEAEVLTRTDAAQVSAILTGRDGKIYLGLSNQGQLATLSAGAAGEGTFISPVLDAGVASAFGKGHLSGQLPEGTSITFRTRSGNAAEPEQGGWSDWSAPVPARTFTPIASPAARYLQYQLVLATSDPAVSPVVDQVAIAYQKPNLPPRITSLAVAAANDPTSPGAQNITWEVADPNEDTLQYTVEARGTDKGGWVTLAKELTTPNFTWPARSAADGRYEIRVTASDASDNELGQAQQAQRTSDPFLNDHTPPTIGDFDTTARDGVVTVKFRAVDRLGTVSSAAYTVNRADGWQIILPDDTIADSPEERYMIALKGLSKGSHTLTVRVTDESGNASFEVVSVSMP
jgi:hypothetical protein